MFRYTLYVPSILNRFERSSRLCMSRFDDWDVYAFNTTDCQGPEFNRGGCQVIHFPRSFSREDLSDSSQYSCQHVDISLVVWLSYCWILFNFL